MLVRRFSGGPGSIHGGTRYVSIKTYYYIYSLSAEFYHYLTNTSRILDNNRRSEHRPRKSHVYAASRRESPRGRGLLQC